MAAKQPNTSEDSKKQTLKPPKQQSKDKHLHPALDAYIARIGADKLNFRRYMVKERKGVYYLERSLIKIEADGSITCTTAEHEPTEVEAKAIRAELAKIEWPRAVGAPNLFKLKITKDKLFEFWDGPRKSIIMCQERVEPKEGGKYYLPWTFFSDGQWRSMEPDGKLPFWKPSTKRNKAKIMVHEGAKAAAFVDDLVNSPKRKKELAAHPWGSELADYEHWGMIGGALAPHRADYAELIAETPVEVVYVCDNDSMGKNALQKVSKYYGRSLKGIMFGNHFPHAWDMADPMPGNLFKNGRWFGPTLDSLKMFATYATETVQSGAKGRPTVVLRQWFADEWIHTVTPDAYAHVDWPHRIMMASEFDDFVAPFSDTLQTSNLVRKQGAIKSAMIKYDPSNPPGLYSGDEEGMCFNTYCPSRIKPERGDAQPWIDYLTHLFPIDHDRKAMERWIATLLARPKIKMMYAILLISETQGVGKSTLGERILEPLLGGLNVSFPSESDIVESDYTYWMAHKRLAFCNEIYAGHNAKAYNKLKDVITGRKVIIKKKYMADYDINNWIHVIACSNNFNALRIRGEDRRWYIPTVNEEKRSSSYWEGFNHWLQFEGGLPFIAQWAVDYFDNGGEVVGKGDAAPRSTAKHRVIEDSYSDGQVMCAHILQTLRIISNDEEDEFYRCVMMDTDFIGLIRDNIYDGQRNDRLERASTIRALAKECGWFAGEAKTQFRDGTRGRLICSHEADAKRPPAEVFKEIVPSRIRLLGKKILVLEPGEHLNIAREDLEDPLFAAAHREAKKAGM